MQLSYTRPVVSAKFDDPNLVAAAGLVPVMRIACSARKHQLRLSTDWPWENAWTALFARALSPPVVVST